MKKVNIILSFALLVMAVSCQRDVVSTEVKAPILNTPEGAVQGQILVKFKSDAEEGFTPLASRAAGRSGVSAIDNTLEVVEARGFNRVFPIDTRREELTRSTGMHLWYVVEFDEERPLSEVAAQLAQLGEVEKVEYLHNLKYADRPTAVAATKTIARAGAGAAVDDPMFGSQWGLQNSGDAITTFGGSIEGADINAVAAWETYAKTAGDSNDQIIVAVMDEGVDYAHPDLANRMWVNEGEAFNQRTDADGNGYMDDVHGYCFVLDGGHVSANANGDTGHGTHVAGIVAAENDNSIGVASIAGGSSNVKIMSLQIFSGYYGSSTVQQAQAVKYAADNGAVVLQCSWGVNSSEASLMIGPGPISNDEEYIYYFGILKESMDYFIENAKSPNGTVDGGVVVFAAGNEEAKLPGYPANYPEYICVTGLAGDYTPAIYTNYGGNSTVAAPGGDRDYYVHEEGEILSTLPTGLFSEGYGYMEGTSMATPMVSGVIALGLSHAANNYRHIKATAVKDLLMQSARSIEEYLVGEKEYYYNSYSTGEDFSPAKHWMDLTKYRNKMGAGIVDADAFLKLIVSDEVGAEMKIPNYTVSVDGQSSDDLSNYFVDKSLQFTVAVSDKTVAEVTISDNKTLTIKGLAVGTTRVTITAQGVSQTVVVTVLNNSANGWL